MEWLTVDMGSLDLVHEIRIQGDPINTFHMGGTKTLIKIGFNLFIVVRPKLINTVLFHMLLYLN
jgi:hypothetical protein